MPLTYAVPDLHGRFDLFQMAMAEINRRHGGFTEIGRQGGGIKVVFLGDYIDRGPQSRQIVEVLIEGPQEGIEWVCLKGNHEDMMAHSIISDDESIEHWCMNGGKTTIGSYGDVGIPFSHIEWMENLPLYHETKHRIYSHAGFDDTKPFEDQTFIDLCWFRCPRDYDYTMNGKHVVHGHTPFRDGPVLLLGRTNLDTYAVGTGRLVVGVFDDDLPGGPIDFIECVI